MRERVPQMQYALGRKHLIPGQIDWLRNTLTNGATMYPEGFLRATQEQAAYAINQSMAKNDYSFPRRCRKMFLPRIFLRAPRRQFLVHPC